MDSGVNAAFVNQYRAKLEAVETGAIASGLDRLERAGKERSRCAGCSIPAGQEHSRRAVPSKTVGSHPSILDLPGVIEGVPRSSSDETARGPADSAAWSGGGSAERGGGGEGLQHDAAYLARLLNRIAVADLVAPPEATQVGSVGFEHVARHLLDVAPPAARALPQGLAGRGRGSRIEGAP